MNSQSSSELDDDEMIRIYHDISRFPGWLAGAAMCFGSEVAARLERIATEFDDSAPSRKAIDNAFRDIDREYRLGIADAETDAERLAILSESIAEMDCLIERFERGNMKWADIEARKVIGAYADKVRLRDQIRSRQTFSEKNRKVVDTRRIQGAKRYPLDRLLNVPDGSYVICRWHNDTKPSMYVRNGWGYCFVCAKSIDSIGWLMEVNGMKFREAVANLEGTDGNRKTVESARR